MTMSVPDPPRRVLLKVCDTMAYAHDKHVARRVQMLPVHSAAWAVAVQTGASAADYAAALAKARGACRQEPNDPYYINTLGALLYRVGEFEEAMLTLRRADELNRASQSPYSRISDLAFLAMAANRLGRAQEARELYGEVRAQITGNEDAATLGILEEARRVCEAPSPDK